MANPSIITATAYKPGGQWKFVHAVMEVQTSSPQTSSMVLLSLTGPNGMVFIPDSNRYFDLIPGTTYTYRIHVIFRPPHATSPIDPNVGITATEDFTFSINGGTIWPPPTDQTVSVPVIEFDPCEARVKS